MDAPHEVGTAAKLSDGFAFLVPETRHAREALEHRYNRTRLVAEGGSVAKLDIASLLGRLSLTFGSSRACNYRFPGSDDISACHFTISFRRDKATLLLTDLSSTGTRVHDVATGESRLVYHTTYDLPRDTHIAIGHNWRYRFHLRIAELTHRVEEFSPLFRQYLDSVQRFAGQSGRDGRRDSGDVKERDGHGGRGPGLRMENEGRGPGHRMENEGRGPGHKMENEGREKDRNVKRRLSGAGAEGDAGKRSRLDS
ncbi:hypothetical protein MBLNU459_g7156t2 [Dothideomycetes sp. NU459]